MLDLAVHKLDEMLLFQSAGCWHFHSEVRRNWDRHFLWEWVKKLHFKIEENLGKEFTISKQAEILTWIFQVIDPVTSLLVILVGFFPLHVLTCLLTQKGFLTKSLSSKLACVCEKFVSYQFFDQNPSFFIKFPNCSTWFCFTNTGVRKVAPAQLLTRQMLVSFTWKTRLWGFSPLFQDDSLLFNQWCCCDLILNERCRVRERMTQK